MKFHEWVTKFGLIDLPIHKGQYTWSNCRENAKRSKLDLFLDITAMEGPVPICVFKRSSGTSQTTVPYYWISINQRMALNLSDLETCG